MSNTMSIITGRKFKALFNEDKIDVNLCRFVARVNDIHSHSFLDENRNRAIKIYERALNNYQNLKHKPTYFMPYPYDGKDWEGAVVYKVPEGFDGSFDDYDIDKVEVIGTLIKDGNKKFVETDLVKIEKLRRVHEFKKMENGRLTVIFSKNTEDCSNPIKYMEYLEKEDVKCNKMITRGHGLSYSI